LTRIPIVLSPKSSKTMLSSLFPFSDINLLNFILIHYLQIVFETLGEETIDIFYGIERYHFRSSKIDAFSTELSSKKIAFIVCIIGWQNAITIINSFFVLTCINTAMPPSIVFVISKISLENKGSISIVLQAKAISLRSWKFSLKDKFIRTAIIESCVTFNSLIICDSLGSHIIISNF